MKVTALTAFAAAISIGLCSSGIAQDVNARYPYRLPDWLWDTPSSAYLVSSEDVLSLRSDIAKLTELAKLSDSRSADSIEVDIAKRLSSKFAIRDLGAGAYMASDPSTGVLLAVQLDPSFSQTAKATLQNAVARFVTAALEPAIIGKAFERSSSTPSPMPAMFATEDGKAKVDEVGRPVFTSEYAFYLKQRARPLDVQHFRNHFLSALRSANGDPAFLAISSYSGNVWWGGGYYGYFSDPIQQLERESPARGYLYIRLNTDKLLSPEPGWNDPDFWASKIAHELLHNLGYWHPAYKDPVERDAANQGDGWAFIVSYEVALYEWLKGAK